MRKSQEVLDKLEQTLWDVSDPNSAYVPNMCTCVYGVCLRMGGDCLRVLFCCVSVPSSQHHQKKHHFSACTGPQYGQHLTRDQVRQLVCPSEEDADTAIKTVTAWLLSVPGDTNTVVTAAFDKDSLTVTIDAAVAEELFEADVRRYTHKALPDVSILRARRSPDGNVYTVPSEIAKLVSMVGNLAHFPSLLEPKTAAAADGTDADAAAGANKEAMRNATTGDWPSDCGKMCAGNLESHVTPAVLQMAYKLGHRPNGTSSTYKGSIAVAEFTGVYWDQKDLTYFGEGCNLGNITIVNRLFFFCYILLDLGALYGCLALRPVASENDRRRTLL